MPAQYTQQQSPMRFKAKLLGEDDLLILGLSGTESLSELFHFQIDLQAPLGQPIPFDAVLGKPAVVSVEVPGSEPRHYQGIISRFAQGPRDENFVRFRAELVPPVWLLTRRAQSRIFQHISVPDILKKVFEGLPVSYRIQGNFQPRDYCVQYRETDFDFASRLMQEEGIHYYFRHTADNCEMVLGNTPNNHDAISDPATLSYDEFGGGSDVLTRVHAWEKVQELRSGKVTLWDHCFELPSHQHLDAETSIQEEVAAGAVTHKLSLPETGALEIYDYPGGYAQRFDGIDAGGAEQPVEVERIFEDNARTAGIRMQEEAAHTLLVRAASNCPRLTAGHKFTLDSHFDAEGEYVLTKVTHTIRLTDGYRSATAFETELKISFECIPSALPFRPAKTIPRQTVKGTQTAVVVGPPGEEIFTDKYSRVKVQFPWDRQGKYDAESSCWIRVATNWAGKGWGVVHIPRIGQEVIVDFLEGDPDQPIIIGSVYNADQMPTYGLPANMTQSGLRTHSSPGGSTENYNEIKFEDKKGQELVSIHAEKDMVETVENNFTRSVGGGLKGDPKKVGKSSTTVYGDHSLNVQKGDFSINVEAGKAGVTVNKEIDVKSNTSFIHVDSPTEIKLTVKGSSITITPDRITLHAAHIKFEGTTDIIGVTPDLNLEGSAQVQLHGKKVIVDGTGEATYQSSGGLADFSAKSKATLGVATQTVVCDTAQVGVSGTAIKAAASGIHEITGAMVKIN